MTLRACRIVDGLYELTSRSTSAFLIVDGDDLFLVDAGWPDWGPMISDALKRLGFELSQLKGVCVTHSHPDHSGGLAYLQRKADFETVMHPVDAEMVRAGKSKRVLKPSPGWVNWLIFKRHIETSPFEVEPGKIDRTVEDGEQIEWAGGLKAIHLPGHAAGQIGLLWPKHGGAMFVADAAVNIIGLAGAIAYEDYAVMLESLSKLTTYDFEVACFGHGKVIKSGAATKFRRRWG